MLAMLTLAMPANALATQTGRRFIVEVRENTQLTAEPQEIVDMPDSPITLVRTLPGR
jgi:hypothetical protein